MRTALSQTNHGTYSLSVAPTSFLWFRLEAKAAARINGHISKNWHCIEASQSVYNRRRFVNVSYDVQLNRTMRRQVLFRNYESGDVGHENRKAFKGCGGFWAMEIEIFKPSRTLLETCFQLQQRSHTVSTCNGFGTCRLAPVAWHLPPGTTCRLVPVARYFSIGTDVVEVGGLNRRHP